MLVLALGFLEDEDSDVLEVDAKVEEVVVVIAILMRLCPCFDRPLTESQKRRRSIGIELGWRMEIGLS